MPPRTDRAFSLLQLIGVLAILVIIGSFLLPRVISYTRTGGDVVQGARDARVDEVAAAVRALKAAALQHYATTGSLAIKGETSITVATTYDHYDRFLVSEQLLDRPFHVRLGSGANVRLVNLSSVSPKVDGNGGAYDLDGQGRNSLVGAAYVLEAVLTGVSDTQARALNDVLDSPDLAGAPGQRDTRGTVTYPPIPDGYTGQVFIYLLHR